MSFQHYPEFHRIMLQDKKLSIPKKYVEKFRKGLSNPIFLIFPNGVEKKIFWVESNGDICFKKNWENIAKCLKYGNLLIFKYIGGSYFKVKIFGVNGLEINYANVTSIVDEEVVKEVAKEIIEVSEDECEIAKQPQRKRNIKTEISMDLDSKQQKFSGSSSRGGMMKKPKKCSTTTAVNVGDNNKKNPFFEVVMTKTYANGTFLGIPSKFTTQHLKKFKGIATLQVGEDMPMQVSLKFYAHNKSVISGGWMVFGQKYNLQVDDVCKFVMTRGRPLSFTVIINRAKKELSPKKNAK